ncbi:hypothetical protein [Halogeometricum borinquense]|uniref:hypothetical protein n=1 Tax=Halogeometricum borinquense TaxID=60847 RepID=UPI001375FEA4|nr:hypothetical protein [Halogeometricum borinquense]
MSVRRDPCVGVLVGVDQSRFDGVESLSVGLVDSTGLAVVAFVVSTTRVRVDVVADS